MKRLLLALLAFGLGGLSPPLASAAGTLDQSQELSGGCCPIIYGSQHVAQTFTAGAGGYLDQVDLVLGRRQGEGNTGPLTVDIRASSGGVPSGPVLATEVVPPESIYLDTTNQGVGAWASIPLNPAAPLVVGATYAIELSAPTTAGPSSDEYVWRAGSFDPYSGGQGLWSQDGGANWTEILPGWDLAFRTFVSAPGAAPLDLSDAGQNANSPQVAIDADGDAIFTWAATTVTGDRIQARARAANGTLSAVQTLSGAGADSPQVAIDADGDAVFTWTRSDGTYDRIQARARAANGTLSAVQTLSGTGQNADTPQVAIDADGDAVFTWQRSDGSNERIQARARAANGTLSAVQTLSGAGNPAEQRPQVAIDADGDAVFTWARHDGSNVRVQARARAANGTLSAVQTLSGTGQNADTPEVAIDADGDAVFTWQRSDGTSERIQARARSAAGTLSAVQTLSGAGQDANSPEVAIDADGDAVFSWQRSDGTSERIQARARSAAGTLSAVQTLSDPGQDANSPEVAIDADGDAVFTWSRFDGTSYRVQARARSAAGALGAVQTLSGAGQSADSPQVAIDADGDTAFTWQRFDGANYRVQAAFGP